ncbi:Ig-like domain-containing protein [Kitasatospora sp. NPDC004669]|uniref:Ig-like domain-containing protein n=1 Tax=Kitasatospora sp. NPDC004669 TaxID=3154555 RepID=UPI0033B87CFE
MSRQSPRTAAALAVLAAGLLTGLNAPLSVARQFPDVWSGEHRAVLPSGLSVQFDFAAAPGVSVTAEPGQLADRSGGGHSAAVYADGMRSGSPAQAFGLTQDRPQADGSWRTVGTLRLSFSRPVRNPRLHLSGLAAVATGKTGTATTAARLTLTGGSPAAPTLVGRTDWPGWTVDAGSLAPSGADGASYGAAGSAAEGTLELVGTVRTAVFRVEQRSTARAGSTTAPPVLRQAYTVTVDEDLGTAPQAYGNASHVVSDLFLGTDAATPSRRDRGRTATTATDGGPMVQLDHGAARRANPFAGPYAGPPPKLQPGRGEYQGADPSIDFPTEAAIGHYYRVTVPVAVSDQPATLAGWIDFDHSGRFDPAGRVQTEIPAGADTATLEWTVPSGAASGETWTRLRIGRDTGQLVASGGFADSGQVSDQRIKLTVGAARPEIAAPVDGTVLAGARPEIRGEGAAAGASVEIRDGDSTLCKARVEHGGDWSCRPGGALPAGPHSLTPVETTSGGAVLRGEAVKVTVKTTPPAVPVLALPADTNDPGLQLTGTGEAGSTVSVTDRSTSAELCSSAVRADGAWSCLPVENLADGSHRLAPVAVDAAGNRTEGQAVTLVVDTVPPDKPVLTSPAAGEVLKVGRPKLSGRAEPGSNVLITARARAAEAGERTVLCGAAVALDGSWTCSANRDLTDGEQRLTVTVTDLAGNGTSADPVRVRVAAAAASPVATGSTAPGPTAASSAAASPAVPSPTVSAPAASGSAPPGPVASVVPSPSVTVPSSSPRPTATVTATSAPTSVPAVTGAAGSPSPTREAAPEVPVFVPVPPGLLPITVPSVVGAPATLTVAVPSAPSASTTPAVSTPTTQATPSARPTAPAIPAVSAPPTRSASPPGSRLSASAADQGGSEADRPSARPLPVPPPAETESAEAERGLAGQPRKARWHGALAGVLLVLTGFGLIARLVFARGPGARRR